MSKITAAGTLGEVGCFSPLWRTWPGEDVGSRKMGPAVLGGRGARVRGITLEVLTHCSDSEGLDKWPQAVLAALNTST